MKIKAGNIRRDLLVAIQEYRDAGGSVPGLASAAGLTPKGLYLIISGESADPRASSIEALYQALYRARLRPRYRKPKRKVVAY